MDKVLDFSLLGLKKNARNKNIDCFRCMIDMQIREAKVRSECSGGW